MGYENIICGQRKIALADDAGSFLMMSNVSNYSIARPSLEISTLVILETSIEKTRGQPIPRDINVPEI